MFSRRYICAKWDQVFFWSNTITRLMSGGREIPLRRYSRTRAGSVRACVAIALLAMAKTIPIASAQTPESSAITEVSAFDLFWLNRQMRIAVQQLQSGYPDLAEGVLRQTVDRGPALPALYYTLAIVLVAQNKLPDALVSLRSAIDAGFSNADGLAADVRFAPLRADPQFETLLDQARSATPTHRFVPVSDTAVAPIEAMTATVSRSNTVWDPQTAVLKAHFAFKGQAAVDASVYGGPDKHLVKLNRWHAKGLVAGNYGDLYDNRDRKHSVVKREHFPQLSFITYSDEAVAREVDYNFNNFLLFNAITIGNSSLAVTGGAVWRSLPRLAYTRPGMMVPLYLQYTNSHLYVYPEHRDHDPKHGDVYPANTPYLIISQGSSGSDRPFVQAVAAILAAFPPATKDFLRETRLTMPTVQMIFRRNQRATGNEKAYLTGVAHPSVFQAGDIDLARMIGMASRLKVEDVPPLPLLRVVEEDEARSDVDYFASGMSEKLFDTASAIARVVRSTAYARRMVISAEDTRDPTGNELRYHWVVLRGDERRIGIRRLDEAGMRVELTVPWHDRRPVPGRPELSTDRVDIGLIVHNGKHYSAPAFISFMFPGNQLRTYDDHNRIVSVDYQEPNVAERYVDPLVFPKRAWKDVYEYNAEGRLIGWQRYRGSDATRYTRHGAQVTSTDALGRAIEAMVPRYVVERGKDGIAWVREEVGRERVHYTYSDNEDVLGTMKVANHN